MLSNEPTKSYLVGSLHEALAPRRGSGLHFPGPLHLQPKLPNRAGAHSEPFRDDQRGWFGLEGGENSFT